MSSPSPLLLPPLGGCAVGADGTCLTHPDDPLWDHGRAAARCGVTRATYQRYAWAGVAPAPDVPDDAAPANRRRPLTHRSRVEHFMAHRPGMGAPGRPRSRPSPE